MTDDLEFPDNDTAIIKLLQHYSPAGPDDRETWRDRLMAADDIAPRELTQQHGKLLAFALLEQNTGQAPNAEAGQVRGCYRLTVAGRRALRQFAEPSSHP